MHLTVYTYLYLLLTFSWMFYFFHDVFYRLISSINNACLILNSILLLICKNERQTIYHVHQSNIFFLYPTMTIKRRSEVIPCSGQDFQDSVRCVYRLRCDGTLLLWGSPMDEWSRPNMRSKKQKHDNKMEARNNVNGSYI